MGIFTAIRIGFPILLLLAAIFRATVFSLGYLLFFFVYCWLRPLEQRLGHKTWKSNSRYWFPAMLYPWMVCLTQIIFQALYAAESDIIINTGLEIFGLVKYKNFGHGVQMLGIDIIVAVTTFICFLRIRKGANGFDYTVETLHRPTTLFIMSWTLGLFLLLSGIAFPSFIALPYFAFFLAVFLLKIVRSSMFNVLSDMLPMFPSQQHGARTHFWDIDTDNVGDTTHNDITVNYDAVWNVNAPRVYVSESEAPHSRLHTDASSPQLNTTIAGQPVVSSVGVSDLDRVVHNARQSVWRHPHEHSNHRPHTQHMPQNAHSSPDEPVVITVDNYLSAAHSDRRKRTLSSAHDMVTMGAQQLEAELNAVLELPVYQPSSRFSVNLIRVSMLYCIAHLILVYIAHLPGGVDRHFPDVLGLYSLSRMGFGLDSIIAALSSISTLFLFVILSEYLAFYANLAFVVSQVRESTTRNIPAIAAMIHFSVIATDAFIPTHSRQHSHSAGGMHAGHAHAGHVRGASSDMAHLARTSSRGRASTGAPGVAATSFGRTQSSLPEVRARVGSVYGPRVKAPRTLKGNIVGVWDAFRTELLVMSLQLARFLCHVVLLVCALLRPSVLSMGFLFFFVISCCLSDRKLKLLMPFIVIYSLLCASVQYFFAIPSLVAQSHSALVPMGLERLSPSFFALLNTLAPALICGLAFMWCILTADNVTALTMRSQKRVATLKHSKTLRIIQLIKAVFFYMCDQFALAMLFFLALYTVNIFHAIFLLFFIVFFSVRRVAKRLWPLLVIYTGGVLCALYAFAIIQPWADTGAHVDAAFHDDYAHYHTLDAQLSGSVPQLASNAHHADMDELSVFPPHARTVVDVDGMATLPEGAAAYASGYLASWRQRTNMMVGVLGGIIAPLRPLVATPSYDKSTPVSTLGSFWSNRSEQLRAPAHHYTPARGHGEIQLLENRASATNTTSVLSTIGFFVPDTNADWWQSLLLYYLCFALSAYQWLISHKKVAAHVGDMISRASPAWFIIRDNIMLIIAYVGVLSCALPYQASVFKLGTAVFVIMSLLAHICMREPRSVLKKIWICAVVFFAIVFLLEYLYQFRVIREWIHEVYPLDRFTPSDMGFELARDASFGIISSISGPVFSFIIAVMYLRVLINKNRFTQKHVEEYYDMMYTNKLMPGAVDNTDHLREEEEWQAKNALIGEMLQDIRHRKGSIMAIVARTHQQHAHLQNSGEAEAVMQVLQSGAERYPSISSNASPTSSDAPTHAVAGAPLPPPVPPPAPPAPEEAADSADEVLERYPAVTPAAIHHPPPPPPPPVAALDVSGESPALSGSPSAHHPSRHAHTRATVHATRDPRVSIEFDELSSSAPYYTLNSPSSVAQSSHASLATSRPLSPPIPTSSPSESLHTPLIPASAESSASPRGLGAAPPPTISSPHALHTPHSAPSAGAAPTTTRSMSGVVPGAPEVEVVAPNGEILHGVHALNAILKEEEGIPDRHGTAFWLLVILPKLVLDVSARLGVLVHKHVYKLVFVFSWILATVIQSPNLINLGLVLWVLLFLFLGKGRHGWGVMAFYSTAMFIARYAYQIGQFDRYEYQHAFSYVGFEYWGSGEIAIRWIWGEALLVALCCLQRVSYLQWRPVPQTLEQLTARQRHQREQRMYKLHERRVKLERELARKKIETIQYDLAMEALRSMNENPHISHLAGRTEAIQSAVETRLNDQRKRRTATTNSFTYEDVVSPSSPRSPYGTAHASPAQTHSADVGDASDDDEALIRVTGGVTEQNISVNSRNINDTVTVPTLQNMHSDRSEEDESQSGAAAIRLPWGRVILNIIWDLLKRMVLFLFSTFPFVGMQLTFFLLLFTAIYRANVMSIFDVIVFIGTYVFLGKQRISRLWTFLILLFSIRILFQYFIVIGASPWWELPWIDMNHIYKRWLLLGSYHVADLHLEFFTVFMACFQRKYWVLEKRQGVYMKPGTAEVDIVQHHKEETERKDEARRHRAASQLEVPLTSEAGMGVPTSSNSTASLPNAGGATSGPSWHASGVRPHVADSTFSFLADIEDDIDEDKEDYELFDHIRPHKSMRVVAGPLLRETHPVFDDANATTAAPDQVLEHTDGRPSSLFSDMRFKPLTVKDLVETQKLSSLPGLPSTSTLDSENDASAADAMDDTEVEYYKGTSSIRDVSAQQRKRRERKRISQTSNLQLWDEDAEVENAVNSVWPILRFVVMLLVDKAIFITVFVISTWRSDFVRVGYFILSIYILFNKDLYFGHVQGVVRCWNYLQRFNVIILALMMIYQTPYMADFLSAHFHTASGSLVSWSRIIGISRFDVNDSGSVVNGYSAQGALHAIIIFLLVEVQRAIFNSAPYMDVVRFWMRVYAQSVLKGRVSAQMRQDKRNEAIAKARWAAKAIDDEFEGILASVDQIEDVLSGKATKFDDVPRSPSAQRSLSSGMSPYTRNFYARDDKSVHITPIDGSTPSSEERKTTGETDVLTPLPTISLARGRRVRQPVGASASPVFPSTPSPASAVSVTAHKDDDTRARALHVGEARSYEFFDDRVLWADPKPVDWEEQLVTEQLNKQRLAELEDEQLKLLDDELDDFELEMRIRREEIQRVQDELLALNEEVMHEMESYSEVQRQLMERIQKRHQEEETRKRSRKLKSRLLSMLRTLKLFIIRGIDPVLLHTYGEYRGHIVELPSKRAPEEKPLLHLLYLLIASYSQLLVILIFLINSIVNPNFLTLVILAALLLYGMLQAPRASQAFVVFMFIYTAALSCSQFIFQMPLFCVTLITRQYSLQPDPACGDLSPSDSEWQRDHLFGIHKVPVEDQFMGYIGWQFVALLLLVWHRSVLMSKGVWFQSEEQLGDDILRKSAEFREWEAQLQVRQFKRKRFIKEHNAAIKKGHDPALLVADDADPCCSRYCVLKALPIEIKQSYYEVIPRSGKAIHLVKPGTDLYFVTFMLELFSSIWIILAYSNMATTSAQNVGSSLNSNFFQGDMVITLFIQVMFIIFDRIIYLKRSLSCKVLLQYITVLYWGWAICFSWPVGAMRGFASNPTLQFFFVLKAGYFILSALQIQYGFPPQDTPNVQALTKDVSLPRYLVFRIYRAIPFVFELRVLLDWYCSKTALDLWDAFKLEDIYASLYIAERLIFIRNDKARGKSVPGILKIVHGLLIFILLILVLFIPLLLFSSANPGSSTNNVVALEISTQLVTNSGAFSLVGISSIASMAIASDDIFAAMRRRSMVDSSDSSNSVQIIQPSSFADTYWTVSPESLDNLSENLSTSTRGIFLQLTITFKRKEPQDRMATSISTTAELTEDNIKSLIDVLDTSKPDATSVVVRKVIPPYFRLPATSDPILLTGSEEFGDMILELKSVDNNPVYDASTRWWSIHLADGPNDEKAPITLTSVSNPVWGTTLLQGFDYSIVAIYTVVVFTIGQFVRLVFGGSTQRIIIEELMDVSRLMRFCQGIYIARAHGLLLREEELYRKLVRIYRSPDKLVELTSRIDDGENVQKPKIE